MAGGKSLAPTLSDAELAAEEWRPWRGTDYEVSSCGRVRRHGRLFSLTGGSVGYPKVRPHINGKPKDENVHAMVAECFIGPRPDGHVVNHIDGTRSNNRVGNLEYVTQQANIQQSVRDGSFPRGERHGRRTHPECTSHGASASAARAVKLGRPGLVDSDIQEMRALHASGVGMPALSERWRISQSQVFNIVHRKQWRHVP